VVSTWYPTIGFRDISRTQTYDPRCRMMWHSSCLLALRSRWPGLPAFSMELVRRSDSWMTSMVQRYFNVKYDGKLVALAAPWHEKESSLFRPGRCPLKSDSAQNFGMCEVDDQPGRYLRFPTNNWKSGVSIQRRNFGIPALRAQSSSMALLTATLVDLYYAG